jgi:uncharacterized membrane protein
MAFWSRPKVIEAMNSGFWLSAAVLATAVGLAAWLLPNQARTEQVERDAQRVTSTGESLDPSSELDPRPMVVQ